MIEGWRGGCASLQVDRGLRGGKCAPFGGKLKAAATDASDIRLVTSGFGGYGACGGA